MNIYMFMLAAVILLVPVFKGTFKKNKRYIIVVTAILFAVCALRGVRVGADLGRYETHYSVCAQLNFEGIFVEYQWNNIGFYFLMKIHNIICGYDFHSFLFILAFLEGVVFAYIIYKHSANPYISVLMYMALGYYVFIYSGLKQALATALLMLAFDAIIERKRLFFIIFSALAVLIHTPAAIFLPAYFIAHRKPNRKMLVGYILAAAIVVAFRGQIVAFLSDAYETVVSTSEIGGGGGKVLLMLVFIIGGYLLRQPDGENQTYATTFNFMIIAAILQVFAVYGNVFERLADYYFIFVIIYLPLVFEKTERREGSAYGRVIYDDTIYSICNIGILGFSIIYYYLNTRAVYGLHPFIFN